MLYRIQYLIEQSVLVQEAYAIGEETYSGKIDELIDELVKVKANLKRGKNKKFYRKESSRIQNAIQSLRYLKKRSEREVMRSDKILISESELINILNKKGMLKVEAKVSGGSFIGGMGSLGKAKDAFVSLYKGATSEAGDSGTADNIVGLIKQKTNEKGEFLREDINNPIPGAIAVSPSAANLLTGTSSSNFTLSMISNTIYLLRYIAATYDNKYYDRSEPTGYYGDRTFSGLDSNNPTVEYIGVKNGYIDDSQKKPANTAGSLESVTSALTADLNNIITGFNKLFKGISEIPEQQTYGDSKYAANNIANDINRMHASLDINSEELIKIILLNIEKQTDLGALSLSKSTQLKPGAMRQLASTITLELRDYYIEELSSARESIVQSLVMLDRMVYNSSKGDHTYSDLNEIRSIFDKVIDTLRSIVIK